MNILCSPKASWKEQWIGPTWHKWPQEVLAWMGVCNDYIVPIKQAENRPVQGVHRIPVWMQTREQMTLQASLWSSIRHWFSVLPGYLPCSRSILRLSEEQASGYSITKWIDRNPNFCLCGCWLVGILVWIMSPKYMHWIPDFTTSAAVLRSLEASQLSKAAESYFQVVS